MSRRARGSCRAAHAEHALFGAHTPKVHPAKDRAPIAVRFGLCCILWVTLAGDRVPLTTSTFYVHAQLDLIHRRVLTAARTAEPGYAVAQQLLNLLSGILKQISAAPTPAGTGAHRADRSAVAWEAILADDPAAHALVPLAALPAISPFRLSRAFTREMGVSLTRYRKRVRVARALDRLEHGENQLAVLAADLGFADQATCAAPYDSTYATRRPRCAAYCTPAHRTDQPHRVTRDVTATARPSDLSRCPPGTWSRA